MARQQVVRRLVLVMCILGFALRVLRLTAQPYWFDEGLTLDLALAPPAYVLETIDRPPLYYLLMHAWIGAAGASGFALRFFSVIWGTFAIAFCYQAGRKLVAERVGLWAAVLATCSPFYVYYAQEARTYTLTLALALVAIWTVLAWRASGRRRWLAVHALATAACFYTHYTALLLPVMTLAIAAGLPGQSVPRRSSATNPVIAGPGGPRRSAPWKVILAGWRLQYADWFPWLAAEVLALALFLPWPLHVRQALPDLAVPDGALPALDPLRYGAQFVWTTLVEWSVGRTLPEPAALALAVGVLFLAVLGALAQTPARRVRLGLGLAVVLPACALLVLPRTATYFSPKYLIGATPAFWLLVALGLEQLRRTAPRLWVACLLALALGWGAALVDWYAWPHVKVA